MIRSACCLRDSRVVGRDVLGESTHVKHDALSDAVVHLCCGRFDLPEWDLNAATPKRGMASTMSSKHAGITRKASNSGISTMTISLG